MKCQITTERILLSCLDEEKSDASCGGQALFVGRVRNHHQGRSVEGLEYQSYDSMAERVFIQIAKEMEEKFEAKNVRIIHRVGYLCIGEIAVLVSISTGHREESFSACRYAIDELKKRAPIWKKEYYEDQTTAWVGCHDTKKEFEVKA